MGPGPVWGAAWVGRWESSPPRSSLQQQQLAAKESEEAITEALKSSKLRFTSESASVLVRLIDGQRFGQLAEPATDEAKAISATCSWQVASSALIGFGSPSGP